MKAVKSARATPPARAGIRAGCARLEFHVSYDCPNRCLFCSEAGRLKRFRRRHPSPAEITGVLRRKRAAGYSHVTFTGGEPTTLSYLPQLLRVAKALGYRTCLTTNGLGFADRETAEVLLAGLDEIILSVHGADENTHDGATGCPGSFARTLGALENIERLAGERIFLISNTLALRGRLELVPPVLRLLGRYGAVKQFLVSCPAPEGRAYAGYASLAPDLDEFAALVPRLAEAAVRRGKLLRFFGVPVCALGEYADLSNDLHWSPRLTVERGRSGGRDVLRETLSLAPVRRRRYGRACAACLFAGLCGGLFVDPGSRAAGLP
jgi:MoaA/NifB/PqqE/SkfB family radical SAM enzyme